MDIKVEGIEAVEKKLEEVKFLFGNIKPVLSLIGNLIQNKASQAFESEKSASGEKWKPNSLRTIHASYGRRTHSKKGKPMKGFLKHASSKKILQNTGHLATSITYTVNEESVVIGTNKEYAAIHQFGGKTGRGKKVNIYARPFLPLEGKSLEKGTTKEVLGMIRGWLESKL